MKKLALRTTHMAFLLAAAALPAAYGQNPASRPVKVVIEGAASEAPDRILPLDPTVRANYEYTGNMSFGVSGEGGKRLTCGAGSAHTTFKIDGQVCYPDQLVPPPGGFKGAVPLPPVPQPLPPAKDKKQRAGVQTTWTRGEIKITMSLELVPGRPYMPKPDPQQKRRMDTILLKYLIENNDTKPRQVGIRLYIDTMCGINDGCLFASPTTHPNVILDGRLLKDKEVPEFIEMLEQPNLQNSGFKGVFTCKVGGKFEGPDKVVLTNLGAFGDWDVAAMPAMGDSAAAFFWEPKEIKPKSQREAAFAIGQGIASIPENEGLVSASFGGNFELNKEFTVTAYVNDPYDGQSLTLELPKGMVRTQGNDIQAVPPPTDSGQSIVLWKARLLELGAHSVRIRASNGSTYAWTVKVSRPD